MRHLLITAIAVEEPRGAAADQVVHAIGLGLNREVVQRLLEELVEQGLLHCIGIGHGAVYTLSTMA